MGGPPVGVEGAADSAEIAGTGPEANFDAVYIKIQIRRIIVAESRSLRSNLHGELNFAEGLICLQVVRNPVFQKAFGHPDDFGINPLGVGEIARFIKVANDTVLSSQAAGGNCVVVAVMSDLDFDLIEIVSLLAPQIHH
ncbi:hypothetical protein D3C73_1025160 [compost metagenome]